jgi:hypothetical protein
MDELDRDDITAQANLAINAALSFYGDRIKWWNYNRSTTSTADGQEFYPVPDDFQSALSMTITVDSNTYLLTEATYHDLEEKSVRDDLSGRPTRFATFQEQFRLYPIPDGTYTLTLSYTKNYSDLSADADTNDWLDHGEEVIRRRAEADLCFSILQDAERAVGFKTLETEARKDLEAETARRVMTGHPRVHRW